MSIWKVIFDGEEQNDEFTSEEEANEYALDLLGCAQEGAEILNMSNPGDYDYDEDSYEDPDYEIIEID